MMIDFIQPLSEIFTELLIPVAVAFVSCIGFAIIFNIRRLHLLVAAAGGALSWLVYLLVVHHHTDILACFWGGFAISLYSELVARPCRTPSTIFLTIGLLPLVPGAGVYYTMKYFVQGQYVDFAAKAMQTLSCAGAIALGVMLIISMVRMLLHIQEMRHEKQKNKAN